MKQKIEERAEQYVRSVVNNSEVQTQLMNNEITIGELLRQAYMAGGASVMHEEYNNLRDEYSNYICWVNENLD